MSYAAADALPGRMLPAPLREELRNVNAAIPIDEGGGASALKVLTIADTIVGNDLGRVVEIGVYRGRLL